MNKLPVSQDEVARALSVLEPGKLPLDIFNQVARLTVTPVTEVVPFYKMPDGSLRVLLLQRGPDDPLWAGMYHVPGAIVSAADQPGSFSNALERIVNSKLVDYAPSEPLFIDVQLCKVARGMEVAIIYAVQLAMSPSDELLFDPLKLPSPMIEGQSDFIKAALQKITEA